MNSLRVCSLNETTLEWAGAVRTAAARGVGLGAGGREDGMDEEAAGAAARGTGGTGSAVLVFRVAGTASLRFLVIVLSPVRERVAHPCARSRRAKSSDPLRLAQS